MTNVIPQHRALAAAVGSLALGSVALLRWPFPDRNALLALVGDRNPWLLAGIKYGYLSMLFTTPYILLSVLLSVGYIFGNRSGKSTAIASLPMFPDTTSTKDPCIVIGEMHHARRPEPVPDPSWLVIPARGLFAGTCILGAIGTGKTSGCMYPFTEQLLGFRAADPERRIGGLVLEVKGDFCHKVRGMMDRLGRGEDYVELGLDSAYRYNPLHNDLDAYTLAYGIASLLNNLYGRGKEPFWQQAYTNLVKFIILLHKVVYGYVTLFDVYECAINPDLIESRVQEGDRKFERRSLLISVGDFMADPSLEKFPFERDPDTGQMKAAYTQNLETHLKSNKIPYELAIESSTPGKTDPLLAEQQGQFEAVKRWYEYDWKRIDARLRTSIVEGISVFLSLFDDNPAVKRIFCPPKEVFDPVANADGHLGRPFPSFAELIESGTVCCLNFPVSANPGLARVIGTLLKQDFQRAVLNRIPKIESARDRHFREVLFLCDEYQAFATVGENDPSGDEKFFALSRQAKCIAIVATQSISSLRSTLTGESWRTLLQTFRTKIFLTLSDDFSARTASEMCGKEEQVKRSYSLSENGHDAGVSLLTGKATAHRASLTTSKTYNLQRDFTFEPKIFTELKNAQSVVLAYDGTNPIPPTYCYLKPYFLDRRRSYFEQLKRGDL